MNGSLELASAAVEIDWEHRVLWTRYPCGATAPAEAHEDPERYSSERIATYRAEATDKGWPADGDLFAYVVEHELLHSFLAERMGLPFSPTIWTAAHFPGAWWVKGEAKRVLHDGRPVTMSREEAWVRTASRFLHGHQPTGDEAPAFVDLGEGRIHLGSLWSDFEALMRPLRPATVKV